MKKIIQLSAWALAPLFLQGCSAKPNVELTIQPGSFNGIAFFVVRAIDDEVIIKSVTVNRGNCELGPITKDQLKKTIKLKFGESFQGVAECTLPSVKETKVSTDAGTFTFSFN